MPGITALMTLACCVMLLLGDREVRKCQKVTFTKDILSAGGQPHEDLTSEGEFNQTKDPEQQREH